MTTRAVAGPAGGRDRLLVLAGLCALVVAQPVLDLYGRNPTALQFRHVERLEIVAFAVAVVVVPPLALWLVGLGAALIDRRAGWVVHVATVGVLFALAGILLSKSLTTVVALDVLAGLAAGVGGTIAYLRVRAVDVWLRYLSAANLVFLASFVFLAPVSDWITSGDQAAAATTFAGGEPASVLMVVLDELPTQSIITADGTIDPVRFPNLSRFSEDATWYRHFSTVSPFTQSAVPALLDGQDPHGDPVWTDHPHNLFSLLARSHHLTVSESLTKLCGFEACSGDPQPPGDATAPGEVAAAPGPSWGAVLHDARTVWADRVEPGPSRSAAALGQFAEVVSAGDGSSATDVAGSNGSVVSVPADQALDGYFASSGAVQPTRLTAFLDALRPTDEPFFGFLHLVLPHQPWFSREDGTRYSTPGEYEGPDITTPWRARVTRQRHLLQAQYTDRLVGQVLARMRAIHEYDDSLIVVVSDHGASFAPGESVRSLVDDNLDDIAYAPLLIKAPGQHHGRIDDEDLLSVDVAPTVADLLGTAPDWPVDGVPATDHEAIAARGDRKYIYDYTDAFSYEFLGIEHFDDRTRFRAMVDGAFPSIAAGEPALAGLYRGQPGAALIGSASADVFAALGPDPGVALVRGLDDLRRPPDDADPLGEVIGVVPSARDGATVVVAVNGTVVGVSPLFDDDRATHQFVVLLPAGALDDGANTVEVGLLDPGGASAIELTLAGAE